MRELVGSPPERIPAVGMHEPGERIVYRAVPHGAQTHEAPLGMRLRHLRKAIRSAPSSFQKRDLREELEVIGKGDLEKRKWLWRLRTGMSVKTAVWLIRLNRGETHEQFATTTGVGLRTIQDMESGKRKPQLSKLNNVLVNTGFAEQFKDVAQIIRLHSQGKDLKNLEDFAKISFGEIIEYLRIQSGYTPVKFGELAGGKSPDWVQLIEKDNYERLSDDNLDALLNAFKIPSEVREFMIKKARREKTELTAEEIAAWRRDYLFSDPIEEGSVPPFSAKDQKISKKLENAANFPEALKILREIMGLSPDDLVSAHTDIYSLEAGDNNPYDQKAAEIILEAGLNLLDLSAQVLLWFAELGNKRRQINRTDYRGSLLFQE